MLEQPIAMDNQPISATFFGEGKWLTDFITPDALEVRELYDELAEGITGLEDKIEVLHNWVASEVEYTKFVRGKIWINGKMSVQDDLWQMPSMLIRTRVGNCSNKSFLLTSLLRNALPSTQVSCVLGNLYNGKPGGHAWVQAKLAGQDYIVEPTRADVPVLVPTYAAKRYEAVHLFNDQQVYTIEGKTVMVPFTACFSTWLRDYLDWSFIESRRGKSNV